MWWLWLIGTVVLLFGLTVFFGAPYVPSQRKYVRRAFRELYPMGEKDVLVDIGAGDGVVLRCARDFGAKAIGYEINPILYGIARFLSRGDEGVMLVLANFWMVPLPDETTVVYAFSVLRDGPRLEKKLQKEANRLQRPLVLLNHGSPLTDKKPDGVFEAYYRYTFTPMQSKSLKV